jgi:hypothetical protein
MVALMGTKTNRLKLAFTVISMILLLCITTQEVIETSDDLIARNREIQRTKLLNLAAKNTSQCMQLQRVETNPDLLSECLEALKRLNYLAPYGEYLNVYNVTERFLITLKASDNTELFKFNLEIGKIRGEIPESIPNYTKPEDLLTWLQKQHEKLVSKL